MGIIVTGIMLIYLACLIIPARIALRSKGGKRLAASFIFMSVILIPTWDIPIVKYRFNKLCEEESGIFVSRQVGLSSDFYLKPGSKVRKLYIYGNGGQVNRLVEATGNELDVEKLKGRFIFKDYTISDVVSWSEVYKYESRVSDGNGVLLGKSVAFRGGGGWLLDEFNLGPSRPGITCPLALLQPDYGTIREKLPYEIFYKLNN